MEKRRPFVSFHKGSTVSTAVTVADDLDIDLDIVSGFSCSTVSTVIQRLRSGHRLGMAE